MNTSLPKIISTLKGNISDIPPIWFMRQAGRYLPEYLKIRSTTSSFLEFCYNPEKASEATLQPISRFDMDAAIIFSDILVIPDALGIDVKFVKGQGPKVAVTDTEDKIKSLDYNSEALQPVYKALSLTKTSLGKKTALIGFAGAPWTLATYMIEGGSSRDFQATKTFAYTNPKLFGKLIDILTKSVSKHLIEQVKSGAQALQIFDSWASAIPDCIFEEYCIKPFYDIVSAVKAIYPDIPIIGFPRGVGSKYADFAEKTGVDALSIDQFTSWKWACENISVPIQGNLDPVLLSSNLELAKKETQAIMDIAKGRPYIFNLGHGILPHTPISNVEEVLQVIRG